MPDIDIDVVEIQNAYKYSNNAKLINTNHSYTTVDNGDNEIGIHYPWTSRSWICSDYFKDLPSSELFVGGCRVTSPVGVHSYNTPGPTGQYQDVTIIGKEILYGYPYTVYERNFSNNIVKSNRAILIHTMQDDNPYYYNISSWGHQWNFYNVTATYTDVYSLPKKRITYTRGYDSDYGEYIIYYLNRDWPYEGLIDTNNNNYVYDSGNTIYDEDYKPYLIYSNTPNYTTLDIDLGNIKLYSPPTKTEQGCNISFGNGYQIHNIKEKTFSGINYNCSNMYSSLYIYSSSSSSVQVDFDYSFLPTFAGEYGKKLSLHPTFGYATGWDMSWFLRDYDRFLTQFNTDGTTIRPAILDHYYAEQGDTYLPTVEINDISEMVYYDGSYYAPIDIQKCQEICEFIENVATTACTNVLLLPASECDRSPYNAYPEDKFYIKKDVTTLRTDVQQSPVNFL